MPAVTGWNPAVRDIGGGENPELLVDKAWNIWVDLNNGPFQFDNAVPPVALNTGDLYSIHVAEEGTAQRVTVFSDQIASRNPVGQADTGFTTQDLDRLYWRDRRAWLDHQPLYRRYLPE